MKKLFALFIALAVSMDSGAATLVNSNLINWVAPVSIPAPALGSATATSQAAGTSNTTVATTAYVYGSLAAPTIGLCSTTACPAFFTTISATGLISPSSTVGIKGTGAADNAQAGSVGEYLTSQGTAFNLTNGTTSAIISVSLSAGDWDVQAVNILTPVASTVVVQSYSAISTATTTLGVQGQYAQQPGSGTAGIGMTQTSPVVRMSLASTTTVYDVVNVAFNVSTATMTGFIRARRVR